MATKQNKDQFGKVPSWLQSRVERTGIPSRHVEIEVKYIIPKTRLSSIIQRRDVKRQELDQFYLSEDLAASVADKLSLPDDIAFEEWRVRCIDKKCFFTAKGSRSDRGTERSEYEIGIAGNP